MDFSIPPNVMCEKLDQKTLPNFALGPKRKKKDNASQGSVSRWLSTHGVSIQMEVHRSLFASDYAC